MRTLLFLWIVIVVVGLVAMRRKLTIHAVSAATCQYAANRALPVSFRLQDGDWSNALPDAPSISGSYTDRMYSKGESICAEKLLSSPQINPGNSNPVALNVPAGPLNAGAIVDIYRNKKIAARNVPVLAILCAAKECSYVVVGVKGADMPAVTEGDATPVLLIRQLP